MTEPGDISIGELSRQVSGVLQRFEGLAARLESNFVRTDNFNLYKQLVDQAINQLQLTQQTLATLENVKNLKEEIDGKASKGSVVGLTERVVQLEDDKKWITRLVIGFIILGVLGAIFAVSKIGG